MVAYNRTLSGLTILVVEDEFLIAADVQRIVEEAGAAQVLLANSIASARKFLADNPRIDLVILDLKLGTEDGMPLARELRDRQIPFVVVTGFDGFGLQDVVVVQKPYNDMQVVLALQAARETSRKA